MSSQVNLTRVEHNVETNQIAEILVGKEQIAYVVSAEILAMREVNATKEAARRAVFVKLGLTEQEIAAIS